MDQRYSTAYDELLNRLHEISDIRAAAAVLEWDQQTYMPPKGAEARARQLGTLERLAHERLIDPRIGELLDTLEDVADQFPYESDEAALLRETRFQYSRATQVPPQFTEEVVAHASHTYQVWSDARPANDFAAVKPALEKTLELSRRYASFFPQYDHPADALIDEMDRGFTVATIRPLFAALRDATTELVQAIVEKPKPDVSILRRHFPEAQQWDYGLAIAAQFGYDLEAGRQDKTLHPFETRFSHGDVRITTRIDENDLATGLFGTLHETGHALYEQGVAPELDGTPLGYGTSAGVHESQSRLWENIVGRSYAFWRHAYPALQSTFAQSLSDVSLDAFYAAINNVEPSLIRVEADEVTYNLHIIVRFELEAELLEGNLTIADLPQAWRERYTHYLGITPPDDRDGVLQDVHWYSGLIGGGFQGYTLGNIMSGQFYEAALQAHPQIPSEIERGEFSTLHTWLRNNIYRHGSKFTAGELLQRITGGPIRLEPYLNYLRTKYTELYKL